MPTVMFWSGSNKHIKHPNRVDVLKMCLNIKKNTLLFTKTREISISLFEKLSGPRSIYLPSVQLPLQMKMFNR